MDQEKIGNLIKKIRKEKINLNTLVPQLIKESQIMSKDIKDRIRVNSFFSEFENKAKNEFHFFINDIN